MEHLYSKKFNSLADLSRNQEVGKELCTFVSKKTPFATNVVKPIPNTIDVLSGVALGVGVSTL